MSMSIRSPAFASGGLIPPRYTCEGDDISPPLEWSGVPELTKSLALIVEDPDAPDPQAPQTTWIHWVVYDIAATVHALPENAALRGLPAGALSGRNDWGKSGYGGPCPPVGQHRYYHRLYALSEVLPDLKEPRKPALVRAMHGKLLAEASLLGLYGRKAGRAGTVR